MLVTIIYLVTGAGFKGMEGGRWLTVTTTDISIAFARYHEVRWSDESRYEDRSRCDGGDAQSL